MALRNFVKISEPTGSDKQQLSHKIISLYTPKNKDNDMYRCKTVITDSSYEQLQWLLGKYIKSSIIQLNAQLDSSRKC